MRFRTPGHPVLFISIILTAVILGCSGSGNKGIVTPDLNPGKASTHSAGSAKILWGMWHVTIDPVTMTAEATPLRTADFTANITNFMQPPSSPTNMVSFIVDGSSDPGMGYFVVDVTLRHPFPGVNKYNGFDVRGALFSDGSITGVHDPSVLWQGPDDTHLVNADGYTRWWNWPEFTSYGSIFGANGGALAPPNQPTSTVNGYKYFADDLDLEEAMVDLDHGMRGFFTTTPGINQRRYEIQFKMAGSDIVYDFNYAIDASWDEPDPGYAPNYPVEAFSMNANCQEAYLVDVNDDQSTAWYVSGTENGGDLVLGIEVYDWQGGANGYVPAEVAGLYVEGDILSGVVDVLSSAVILPGSSVNSSIYEVTIGSLNLTGSGEFELFGTVENTAPNTYEPQVAGGSGFNFPSEPLAAFFTCIVTVHDVSPGDPPEVTSIDPNFGLPDCTPDFVTVYGSNFESGATFRLERDGFADFDAENVVWVDEFTLEGDLPLAGAESGLWDVMVENPTGLTGTLEDAFDVLDAIYVDGDNAGDPSMDGTMAHPYDTIQGGIDAAYSSNDEPVIIDQSAVPYDPFSLRNNSHVIGCNWNDGVGWPTVEQDAHNQYGNNVSNVTIEGLFFDLFMDYEIYDSGLGGNYAIGLYFQQGDGITITGCKFSAEVTRIRGIVVRFSRSLNVEISYCYFNEIYQEAIETNWRVLYVIQCGGTNGVEINHCEFHDIGYDVWDAGAYGTGLYIIRVGYESSTPPHNVDLHNLLIYDVYNATDCIRPSPNPDPQNAVSCISLSNINSWDWVGDFKLYNITIDDIRHADTPSTTTVNAGHVNGGYFGMVGGDDIVMKNNIVSNIIGTDDPVIYGNTSYYGWWIDGYVQPGPSPYPMDNSAVYNVCWPDLPPNENWSSGWYNGWCNQVMAGTGCIYNYQNVDPQYSTTPGATFYHPQNTQYSTGGDDGGEMGAFGGPEGDWLPPSQL